ncbi:hypothetical protein CA267_016010 [Alteromonas pelagimontana]|uniref:Uncharacterized protein n=1 Tax=Alteromonas pelagimontana TaxID=1858656 RepID=A0A6M4MGR9_9ALTE|nr:hypothetical protein [Alteromonas pelagimontana]QJR82147.1 hypothetical protein CA267_016010 [Alteromonas pelagimontana]
MYIATDEENSLSLTLFTHTAQRGGKESFANDGRHLYLHCDRLERNLGIGLDNTLLAELDDGNGKRHWV